MVEFDRNIRKMGRTHYVTIPAQYVHDAHLQAGKKYRFSVVEVTNAS